MALNVAYRYAVHGYSEMILSSKPVQGVCCMGMSCGSKLPSRGDFDRQFAKLTFERLQTFTVTRITCLVTSGCKLVMAKVFSDFSLQRTFNQCFGELLEKTILPNQVFLLSIKSRGKSFGKTIFYQFLKIAVFCKTFTQNYIHPQLALVLT